MRWVCFFSLTISCLLSVAPDACGANLRTVALSGQQAPGTTAGVVYDSFPRVRLDDLGRVAFSAALEGNVNPLDDFGIWSERSGELGLTLRKGDRAPGTPEGVFFDRFSFDLTPAGRMLVTGRVVGDGVVSNENNFGIWLEDSGAFELIVRNGDQAPGMDEGVRFNSVVSTLNSAGQIALSADLTEGIDGERPATTNTLWLYDGSLSLIATITEQTAGLPAGTSFRRIEQFALSSTGEVTFSSNFAPEDGSGSFVAGIWRTATDTLDPVFISDQEVVDPPGPGVFRSHDSRFVSNESGQIAFVAGFQDPTGDGASGIWVEEGDSFRLAVPTSGENDPFATRSPGSSRYYGPDNTVCCSSEPLSLSPEGRVKFLVHGYHPLAGVIAFGVWQEVGDLEYQPIFRLGTHAPGTPEDVSFALLYNSWSVSSSGQLLIDAILSGESVHNGNARGLWVEDKAGVLRLLARVGDELLVGPDDRRIIGSVQATDFNDQGHVVFRARFTDGTAGIFVSDVGAIPEPTAGALLTVAMVSLAACRHRRQS